MACPSRRRRRTGRLHLACGRVKATTIGSRVGTSQWQTRRVPRRWQRRRALPLRRRGRVAPRGSRCAVCTQQGCRARREGAGPGRRLGRGWSTEPGIRAAEQRPQPRRRRWACGLRGGRRRGEVQQGAPSSCGSRSSTGPGLEHGTRHPGDGVEAATVQEEVGVRTARRQAARRGEAAAVSREDRKTSSEKRAEFETSEELSGRRARKTEISRKMGLTSTAVCER